MKKFVKLTVLYQNVKASAVVTADINDEDDWDRMTIPEHIMCQMATDLGCPSGGDFTYIVSEALTASHDGRFVVRGFKMNNHGLWFACGSYAPVGYSPRIFLLSEYERREDELTKAHQYLKEQSIWKGCDKRWDSPMGDWLGYEIPRAQYESCIVYLHHLLGQPIDQRQALSK